MKRIVSFIFALILCFSWVNMAFATSSPIASDIKKNGRTLTSTDGLKLFDVVTFGSYPQTSFGDYADIEWYVIGINGSKLKLLSKYALDSRRYHDSNTTVTWQGSSLYNWLNSTFKSTAFTADEQKFLIAPVSLLSVSEAEDIPVDYRICQSTAYAVTQGADKNRCIWWLSSYSGEYEIFNGWYYWWDYGWYYDTRAANCSSVVTETGVIGRAGYQVNYSGKTVRPTVVLDLEGSLTSNNSFQSSTGEQAAVSKNGRAVTSASSLRVNDVITFGSYPQTSYSDTAAIEWVVLGIEGNKVKLVSKYALDSKRYHDSNTNVNWQSSSLYHWLNDSFKSTAFTQEEQQMLAMPVTLPTLQDATDMSQSLRICQPTSYAIAQGVDKNRCIWWLSSDSGEYQVRNNEWWWSDTRTANCASAVMENGVVAKAGFQVNYNGKAVRPVIIIGF